jgi:imidazoleglycerol phosphate dehydratase HisB
MQPRAAQVQRDTKETRIRLKLVVDGRGRSKIKTGVPFFDHMLTLFAKHSTTDLTLACQGDLEVDAHHTVEDCGIALGQAFREALGDKKGLRRYGTGFDPRNPFTGEAYVPMDECLARCVIDFSGRSYLVSLIAPRPLLLQTGDTDIWSDPKGEFLAALSATKVYELLGASGLETPQMPQPGQIVGGTLAYYMHAGGHGSIPSDWDVFLRFMEEHF